MAIYYDFAGADLGGMTMVTSHPHPLARQPISTSVLLLCVLLNYFDVILCPSSSQISPDPSMLACFARWGSQSPPLKNPRSANASCSVLKIISDARKQSWMYTHSLWTWPLSNYDAVWNVRKLEVGLGLTDILLFRVSSMGRIYDFVLCSSRRRRRVSLTGIEYSLRRPNQSDLYAAALVRKLRKRSSWRRWRACANAV